MKKLLLLLGELSDLKAVINKRKRKLNKVLLKKCHKWVWFLHIIVALCIIMNFGAVFLTNMLVIKTVPNAVIREANPIQASIHGYEDGGIEGIALIYAFVVQSLFWTVLLFLYFYSIRKVYTMKQLYWVTAMVFFYFIIIGMDFFNDFGFYIGRAFYG